MMPVLHDWYPGDGVLAFFATVAVGVLLVSAGAWTVSRQLPKKPAIRHLVLMSALFGCLGMPILAAAFAACGLTIVSIPLLPDTRERPDRRIDIAEIQAGPVLSPRETTRQVASTISASERSESSQFGDALSIDGPPNRAAGLANAAESSAIQRRPQNSRVAQSTPRPRSYRSIATLILLGWGCGSMLLLLRLGRGCLRIRDLRRASSPLRNPSLQRVLDDVCQGLGLRPPPPVLVSRHVATPLATGILSPVVILPERLLDVVNLAEMRDVLWHEAAHLSRHDPPIVLLQEMARALYWPIPPMHGLIRELGRAREDLCDNHVLQHRDAVSYGETLLHLAELSQKVRPPFPAIGILHWKGELERRIGGLLDQGRSTMTRNNRRLVWPVALLFVTVGTIASGTRLSAGGQQGERAGETPKPESPKSSAPAKAVEQPKPSDAPEKSTGRTVNLKTIHKDTGEAIPNVAVRVQTNGRSQDSKMDQDLTTDSAGGLTIQLPLGAPAFVSITVKVDGFVPLQVSWRREEDVAKIPSEYTIRMERGTTIGGVIQDEKGQPIAAATVYVLLSSTNPAGEPHVYLWDYPAKTDEHGRWHCNLIPAQFDDVWIRLVHADYISDDTYGETPKPTQAQLRNQTGVMVMKKGLTVRGRVIDAASDQPIQEAEVLVGSDRFGSHYPQTKTDADGRFEFRNRKPGELVLTVKAKSHAPDLKTLMVSARTGPVEFRLEPGRVIRGRLVDQQGRPVAGAFVAADTWRGHRSLMWRVNSDAEGRFRWEEAPPDAVLVDMGQTGFATIRRRSLTPSPQEYTITMSRPLRIHGTVVDAETGRPIDAFQVVSAIDWANSQAPHWERSGARPMNAGQYERSFSEPYPGRLLRIEAHGYKPAVSRVYKSDEGDQVFDVRLEKGTDLVGIVRLPDGAPLEGAEIALVPARQNLLLQDGRLRNRRDPAVAGSDAQGRFRFPPQDGAFTLIALHDRGFARRTSAQLAESKALVVEPWGRVEGTLRVGDRPGAGEQLTLNPESIQQTQDGIISFFFSATADANGRFAFDRVPPGKAWVGRTIKLSEHMSTSSHSISIQVDAGRTVRADVGGTGRPVVGRVTVPAAINGPIDFSIGFNSIRAKAKQPPPPEGLSREKRAEWFKKWMETEDGQAFQRSQHLSYTVKVEPNGSFRADDVPAGTYQLSIQVHESGGEKRGVGELLGSASHDFTVPEMPGGRSDELLDIGSLELKLAVRLKVGDAAPAFEIKTIDGKPLRLADYRGKYVLLDFWATWCGPCRGETPHLKAVQDAFGKDDRFAMVGLSLDEKPEEPRKYASDCDLHWPQGFLGEWSKSDVPDHYGVRGIPSIWLIGPDGKVVAKDLRGERIKDTVAKALIGK